MCGEGAGSPEWEYRYYLVDSLWGREMVASMRNGSGDEYFILFDDHGAAIKGSITTHPCCLKFGRACHLVWHVRPVSL
jgi:hypothetical protein